jgi:hypothetical protein
LGNERADELENHIAVAGRAMTNTFRFHEGTNADGGIGSNFNVCLKNTVEAKMTLDEGGEPCVLRDYATPTTPV